MRTRYKIDTYQQTYFVIDSFEQLFEMTAADFAPIYERVKTLPELPADARLAA
jgi:phenylalanine-4-hydroxylase